MNIDLYKKLSKVFSRQLDHRMELLADVEKFSGVVQTISERDVKDAASIICQAILVTLANPALLNFSTSADMIIYSLVSEDDSGWSNDVRDIFIYLEPKERMGIVSWLKWIRENDFGGWCRDDVFRAIKIWDEMIAGVDP